MPCGTRVSFIGLQRPLASLGRESPVAFMADGKWVLGDLQTRIGVPDPVAALSGAFGSAMVSSPLLQKPGELVGWATPIAPGDSHLI